MKDNDRYTHVLKKVRERLTMVFDYHIPNGKPLIDSDRDLLQVLHGSYEDGLFDFLARQPMQKESPIQQDLFTTPEGPLLPFQKPDTSSEEKPGK